MDSNPAQGEFSFKAFNIEFKFYHIDIYIFKRGLQMLASSFVVDSVLCWLDLVRLIANTDQ